MFNDAMKLGAKGNLLKEVAVLEIITAIKT